MRGYAVRHPEAPELGFLYGTILTDGAVSEPVSRNLCVFGKGQIDRSPTGSGVAARLAVDATRGWVGPGETRDFCGPTGVRFSGTVIAAEPLAGMPAFRMRVAGSAFYSGEATFIAEADDPLADGFELSDGLPG